MGPDEEIAIVEALYRGACDEGEMMRAVGRLAVAFNCPSLLMGDLDDADQRKTSLVGAGVMDAARVEEYKTFAHIDYMTPAFMRLLPGKADLLYRLIDEAEAQRQAFYEGFIAPLSLGQTLASPLHVSGSRVAMIALHQGKGRRVLGDEDIEALERLAPHLARVLHARRAFLGLKARQATYAEIVDRSATGLVGRGRDGAVLFVNAAMRALAAGRDGLSLDRHGSVILADREASRQAARWHADVLAGGAGGYVRVPRPSRRPPYTLSVSRLPVHDEALPPGGILFAAVDPSRRRLPTAAEVAAVLGLPPGPAGVAQALACGEDLKAYAGRAELGLSTVRTHLKAAFQRTGTHSQADLVRLTLATAGDLVPLRDRHGPAFALPSRPED